MKIERHFAPGVPEMTLEQLAEKYDLTMVLYERSSSNRARHKSPRFYCFFRNIDLYNNGLLVTFAGNGETEKKAINDYKRQLNLHTGEVMVISDGLSSRKEITIPKII